MKFLVTGVGGQLGYDVMKECARRKIEATGAARREMPLTDFDAAGAFIINEKPDAVIHCAAYTAVDKAEDEPELCRAVNEGASRAIARACKSVDAKMVYVSTDYVFGGEGEKFYETDDKTAPKNVYGASKLAGENAVRESLEKFFIVRTSWVFGVNGKNFVKTMLNIAKTKDALSVVGDQYGSPTYAADLAPLLVDMALSEKYGVYHGTNEGICSWAQFAEEIFRQSGLNVSVTSVSSENWPTKALRPKNSRLSKSSLDSAGFSRLPIWQEALSRYLKEMKLTEKDSL